MLAEKSRRRAVHERGAGPGINERHRDVEVLIDLAQLTEVGELARA